MTEDAALLPHAAKRREKKRDEKNRAVFIYCFTKRLEKSTVNVYETSPEP